MSDVLDLLAPGERLARPDLAEQALEGLVRASAYRRTEAMHCRVAVADITTRDGGPLLEVALWSRNLLDETYVYRRDPSNRATLGDYGNFNNPRTFGI